jgi:RHS repeat-associated protein
MTMPLLPNSRSQGLDKGTDGLRPPARRRRGRAPRTIAGGLAATLLVALSVLPAQAAGASALAAGRATAPGAQAQQKLTLAERRAEVRAQTSPARIAESSLHPHLTQGQEHSAKARTRNAKILPHGTLRDGKTIVRDSPGRGTGTGIGQLRAAPQQSSSDVWYPESSDSWITDPAGGVTSAETACYYPPSSGDYNEVPGCFGPTGDVYAGEKLAVTDEFWLACNDTGVVGCGYPPEVTQSVSVYFEVVCQPFNVPGESNFTLIPEFDSQTVTASIDPDFGAPDDLALAQATFTMPTTTSCPMGPGENGGFPNAYVEAVATSDGVADPGGDSSVTYFNENGGETSIAPAPESNGAPCAQDSAGPGQSTAWGGDPVNTLQGECAETATDATLQTPGYPLTIQRNYSSALAAASGPLGPGWTMPWFASLSVNSTTGNVTFNAENGNQYLYTSDGGGTFTPPDGATSVLAQLSSGDYTLTTRQQDVLTFSSSGQLLSEVDPTGRGLTMSYTSGELTSVTDAAGQKVTLAYTGSLLTTITLPNGHTIAYGYTGGLLTAATVPGGSAGYKTSYAYNSSDLLTTVTDANGNVALQNAYNSAGQITSQTDGTGAVTQFSYTTTSSGLAETDVTDPNGGIWTYLYGGNVLMEVIDPLGNQTQYAYNGFLEPAEVTDPLGGFTSMTYDEFGNLLTQTDPLGNTQQWAYDGSNNLLTYTDGNDNVTTWTYNSMDEPTSMTDAEGNETSYTYNNTGELTAAVDPRGNVSGATAASYTTSYGYNAADELTSVTNPGGGKTTYAYDSMGYLTSVTDPLGRVTSYSYDADERLTGVTVPGGGKTTYGYDGTDDVTSRTDADGNTWSYTYNSDFELVKATDPLGASESYTYDGDGNQLTYTDASGAVTTTTYDADNRPLKITYSDGTPTVTYAYDADGDQTTVTDGTGTRTLGYDADGELTTEKGPGSGSFSYSYDSDGNVLTRTYPDGSAASYTYSADNQISSLTAGTATTNYSYDPAGDPTSVALPDGVTETGTYNGTGEQTGLAYTKGSTTLDSYGLTLNADGQPTQEAVTQDGTAQPTSYYAYSSAGSLASACATSSGSSACSAASAGTATGTAANPAAPGPPTGMVTSGEPGDCMDDYHSGTTSGTKVDIYPCSGAASSQQWTMETNNTIQIHGLCVAEAGTSAGSLVELATCSSGSTAQEWTVAANQELENTASGKCLDAPSTTAGTQLEVETCANAAAQHWRPPYDALAYSGELTSGTAGDCLDDYHSGTTSGTKVDIYTCSGAASSQLWTVQDSGTVQIHGLCLAVKSSGTANGDLVELDTCDGDANQQWAPAPYGLLVNPVSDKCLDAPSTTIGTQLEIETCATTAAQEWTLPSTTIPADPTGVSVTAGAGSATLAWTPPSTSGGSKLAGYTVTSSGGQTATAGPYATSATVSGLTAGTSYTFTIKAANGVGSNTTAATSAVTPGNETTYTYDPAGNLTSSETDGLTTTSTYNADEELTQSVTGSSTVSYAYDADGQQTTAGSDTDSYNAAGELSKAVTPAGTFTYGYDASGDLASTSLGGSLIQDTVWDLDNQLPQAVEETNSSGTTTADYLYGEAGSLESMTTSAGSYYPVGNSTNSVTGLLNSSGTQVSEVNYSPYGTSSQTSLASGAPTSSIGYAGSYTMPGGTGLDDMRARDYSPATAGFTSADPMALLTGQPYAYAADDPVEFTDPSGLCSWYNYFCDVQQHWRGALKITAAVAGIAAVAVCTAATDGICGIAIELSIGYELPLGSLLGAVGINAAEGALDYAVSGGCQSWTGLGVAVGEHALFGLGEGAVEELAPTLEPSDGAHAIPTNWWHTWSQFNPF